MRLRLAALLRRLDPRLKLGVALVMGPGLWLLDPWLVLPLCAALVVSLSALSLSRPLGPKMVRSLCFFVCAWMAVKMGIDVWSGVEAVQVVKGGAVLGLRLFSLLLLGMSLALSASPRSLGLALSWAVRPFVGAERAWKLALSLSLMIHFLPITVETMNEVKTTLKRRWPSCGLRHRMRVIPQAVLRNLGQKTWNQTLAVAGRGLEGGDAWEPEFSWSLADTACSALALSVVVLIALL